MAASQAWVLTLALLAGLSATVAGTATISGQESPDASGPTIAATYQPPANSAGWHRGPVRVVFTCGDDQSGVAACPEPIAFSKEGAGQGVLVTAADRRGNLTHRGLSVNLDGTPPILTLSGDPSRSATRDATARITAHVNDDLSGVASVTCNGTPLPIVSDDLECTVSLAPGRNLVLLQAQDYAGNSTSRALSVARTKPPGALLIVPSRQEVRLGITRDLVVIDEFGGRPGSLEWTTSDPDIAAVDPTGVVTALTVGEARISACLERLCATVDIDVVPDEPRVIGAVVWSLEPLPGYRNLGMTRAGPTSDYTSMVVLEGGAEGRKPVLRGFDSAGGPTYQVTLPFAAPETDTWPQGSKKGSVVVRVGDGLWSVNVHADQGNWRYAPPSGFEVARWAVGDDTVFALLTAPASSVGAARVAGVDLHSGVLKFEIDLPVSSRRVDGTPGCSSSWTSFAETVHAEGFKIDLAGRLNVPAVIEEEHVTYSFADCASTTVRRTRVELHRVDEQGIVTVVPIMEASEPDAWPRGPVAHVLPDGRDGVLVWWPCGADHCLRASHVTSASQASHPFSLSIRPTVSTDIVMYGSGLHDSLTRAVDMQSGRTVETYPIRRTPIALFWSVENAIAIGIENDERMIIHDRTGAVLAALPLGWTGFFIADSWYFSDEAGLRALIGPALDFAHVGWSLY